MPRTGRRGGPSQQLGELLTQRTEQLLQPRQGELRFKRLSECLPTAARFPKLASLLLSQGDQALQSRRETRKVRILTRLTPAVVAICLGRRQFGDQCWIQGLLAAQIVLQQIDIAAARGSNR